MNILYKIMPIQLNGEIIIGITLITMGVISFAKGASTKLSNDNYLKSAHNVSNLVNTATSVHNISNTLKKKNNIIKE
jgi:hypothetical protein